MTTATIAAGQTTSAPVDVSLFKEVDNQIVTGLTFPSTWTNGTVSFLSSSDHGNSYQPVLSSGTPYSVSATAGQSVALSSTVFASITNFIVVSSVAQASAATIQVAISSPLTLSYTSSSSGGGGSSSTVTPVTGSTTLSATAGNVSVRLTAAATLTLPAAPANGTKLVITDDAGNFATYNATILAGGSDTIDNASSVVMANPNESITVTYISANANWELN
jgi:hypothetical protein